MPPKELEKLKDRANRYIHSIMVGVYTQEIHGQINKPVIFMSRDVFEIIVGYIDRGIYIRADAKTICGCNIEIVDGVDKLYLGIDLLK